MKTTKKHQELELKIKELEKRISLITDPDGIHTPIQDGIVDLDKYVNSKYRIMWVMKDANSADDSDWDQRHAIADLKTVGGIKKGWEKTFQHIVYTTYGILNNLKWDEIPSIEDQVDMVDVLKSIAYINIKKIPGGSTVSDGTLVMYYDKDKELLLEQINSFEPDIIIFGNTLKYFQSDLSLDNVNSMNLVEYATYNDKLLINGYHPNYISRGGVNAKEHYSEIKKVCDKYLIAK